MLTARISLVLFLSPHFFIGCDAPREDAVEDSQAELRRGSGPLEPGEIQRIRDAVGASLGTGFATGYSVAVWRDGRVVYKEGFGEKNEGGEAVTPATLFQIGSDTKKLTAVALLREVDAGHIGLDDTVGDIDPSLVLAESPDALAHLSIDDLLSQRSGLFDYTPWFEASDDDELASLVRGRFAENEHAMMPSGIAWSYSNPNYYLAGYLTEVLDGRAWSDIVTDDVLRPLGMHHTYARRDDMLARESDIASGFGLTVDFDTFSLVELLELLLSTDEIGWAEPDEQRDNAMVRPAGLVWSTAADQARLLGFFIDGNDCVLSEELRGDMMSAQTEVAFLADTIVSAYGYGLFVDDGYDATDGLHYQVPFVFHGGNTPSMTSESILLPEQRVAVSVLANGYGEFLSPVAQVALEAAAGARLPAPTPAQPDFEPPAEDLQVYAGTYHDRNLGEVTITWDTDHLAIDIPLLTGAGFEVGPTLEPVALDQFDLTLEGGPLRIVFHDGTDGTPRRYGVDRNFVLTRD